MLAYREVRTYLLQIPLKANSAKAIRVKKNKENICENINVVKFEKKNGILGSTPVKRRIQNNLYINEITNTNNNSNLETCNNRENNLDEIDNYLYNSIPNEIKALCNKKAKQRLVSGVVKSIYKEIDLQFEKTTLKTFVNEIICSNSNLVIRFPIPVKNNCCKEINLY